MIFRNILIFLGFIISCSAFAGVEVQYSPPHTEEEKIWLEEIQASGINELVISLSKEHFPFSKKVLLAYGEEDGPAYDSQAQAIYLPYMFYGEAKAYFAKNHYQKEYGKSARDGAIDTLFHTLLHELGHAYVFNYAIPVLGKEEDAVDDFASIILLNYVDDGDEIAISAADMFAFESEDTNRPDHYAAYEYIDEHSFDLQRYFSTLCLVYGSNPQQHAHLLDQIEKEDLEDRKQFCEERFMQVNQNWQVFLHKKSP